MLRIRRFQREYLKDSDENSANLARIPSWVLMGIMREIRFKSWEKSHDYYEESKENREDTIGNSVRILRDL